MESSTAALILRRPLEGKRRKKRVQEGKAAGLKFQAATVPLHVPATDRAGAHVGPPLPFRTFAAVRFDDVLNIAATQ